MYSVGQTGAAYIVHLDATHVVEVRKQGEQIGIYTVTTSGKKRGILLPIDSWHSLEKYRHLINVAIDLSVGTLTTEKVAETVFHSQQQQPCTTQHQVQGIKYIYNTNNGCPRSRFSTPSSRGIYSSCNKQTELSNSTQTGAIISRTAGSTTTATTGTVTPLQQQMLCPTNTVTIPQHLLDKQDGYETVPVLEYYGFPRNDGSSGGCGQPASAEEETSGDVDAYGGAYVC